MKKAFVSVIALSLALSLAAPVSVQAAAPVSVSISYGKVSKADSNVISQLFDETYYASAYPDVVNALGNTRKALFNHFITYGIFEGRNPNADFNVSAYASGYGDLREAFGDNVAAYFVHYFNHGKGEGRSITTIEKALNAGITVTSVFDGTVIATPAPKAAPSPAPAPSAAPATSNEQQSGDQGQSSSASQSSSSGYQSASSVPRENWNSVPNYSAAEIRSQVAKVIELVNAERAKEGLSPLTEAPLLDVSASIRVGEIPVLFEHDRPDGTGFETSVNIDLLGATTLGENIAAGLKTAETVMEAWMNSPGHRANIMRPEFTRIGVAYGTADTPYGTYWVQHFSN